MHKWLNPTLTDEVFMVGSDSLFQLLKGHVPTSSCTFTIGYGEIKESLGNTLHAPKYIKSLLGNMTPLEVPLSLCWL